jgi:hypothetical protein
MSETQTEPPVDPVVPNPQPSPNPEPVSEPAPDTPEEAEQKEAAAEGRRIAQLRARLGAAERERDRQAAEAAYYRERAQQGGVPENETDEQRWQRVQAEADVRAEEKLLVRRFHEEGAAQFNDWKQRCDDLMGMGADPAFARLLVDTPGGVRIAAALAEDPDALERITRLQTPHGRAVALGKFAASIEDQPARANGLSQERQVTRAPAPVRPVTGRASPVFNAYTATGQQLVDKWMRESLEARMKR